MARELHRRRWQHCRVVESSSWGPGSDVALVLFLAAIHRYPRKLVRPLLNCWTFFAVFNSLGKLFHFSTTLTVKKLVLVSSLVLGITSLCGSPVLLVATPVRASGLLNNVAGSKSPAPFSILNSSRRSCFSLLRCSVSKLSSLHFSS